MPEQSIVLDTHIWLWTVTGDRTIKTAIKQKISQSLKTGRVLVPAICLWEVGMLWKKERIQLRQPLRDWIEDAFDKSGFSLAPMNEAIALEASLLPGKFHNDPADCIIVATARLEKSLLLTRDSRIIDYGKGGHVDVLIA